uniref:Gamma-glutamyltransferase n=1 Tax=Hanusia phi TaxID=3032 RepID=A0A7S0EHN0_9CRYP
MHRMIDGMNMAWSDRNKYLADPDWVDIPVRYENDEYCEQFTSSATCPAGCGWNRADGGSEEGKYLTGTRGELRGCRSIGLLSKDYANARRDRFSSLFKIAQVPLPPGNFSSIADDTWLADYKDKVGTTHLSVIDRWGNMVSMTTTIEENLGTGIVVKGRGFLLNNELTDFSFNSKTGSGSGYANRPEGGKRTRRTALGQDAQTFGGKRPRSSMTPTIVLTPDGKPFLAIGTPGGGRITYTVFNALLAILDRNETLKEAIDAPRCISMNGVTELESAYNCNCSSALPQDRYLVSALRARGLQFTTSPSSSTSPYLEAALLRPDASLSCYADQQRMQTAQAFCEGKLDVSGWKK